MSIWIELEKNILQTEEQIRNDRCIRGKISDDLIDIQPLKSLVFKFSLHLSEICDT